MPFEVLASLMVKIIIMVLFGFLLKKLRMIDDAFQRQLSSVLLKAVLPLSILVASNREYSAGISGNLPMAALISFAYFLVAIPLVFFAIRPFHLSDAKNGIFITLAVFGNSAFIGFPVAAELFGNEGTLYAVLYNLLFNIFLFTAGVRLLSHKTKFNWRHLITPLTIVPILSLLLFLSPFRLPEGIASAFALIGEMSVPLSMLIIGASLADIRFSQIWTDKWAYFVSALRMLALPLAMLGILRWLGFTGVLPSTLVVLTALAPASMNVILAEQYKKDVPFTTKAVVQGLVLMVVTLPLILYLAGLAF